MQNFKQDHLHHNGPQNVSILLFLINEG